MFSSGRDIPKVLLIFIRRIVLSAATTLVVRVRTTDRPMHATRAENPDNSAVRPPMLVLPVNLRFFASDVLYGVYTVESSAANSTIV